MNKAALALTVAAGVLTASPALAQSQDSRWFVHLGATRLKLADHIDLTAGGTVVPNAGISTKPHFTPTVQAGRFIDDHFAIALTVGLPPHIAIQGDKALLPYGKLAETTYGPALLTFQYHLVSQGPVRPYVGAGAAYMVIFSTKDAAFQNVRIGNDLGPAVEAGTDIMLSDRYGIFIDAKKAFLRTTARGTFGGMPVVGKVRLDPLALTAGVVARF
jgi:outer membrane protein